jgi:RNA recognition motif-containing protein
MARASHRLRPYKTQKKSFFRKLSTTELASRLFQPQHTKMESTRVFVSGLPPSCSNDQLRSHFSGRFQVTDAHVLPKRRMGFVGFKSNEVAKEAASYFNRTYMKMSKISVDLARPVCESCVVASIVFCLFLRPR